MKYIFTFLKTDEDYLKKVSKIMIKTIKELMKLDNTVEVNIDTGEITDDFNRTDGDNINANDGWTEVKFKDNKKNKK